MKTITPFIIYAENSRLHEVGKLCEEAGFKFTGGITASIEPEDTMVHSLRAGGTECEYHSSCIYSGAEDATVFNYPSDLKAIKKHLGLKTTVDFTPLPEITGFGVKGSKSLLKAFVTEAELLGWKLHENDDLGEGAWFNSGNNEADLPIEEFWTNDACSPTSDPSERIFNLPSQWNEAVECLKLINKPKTLEVTLQQVADKFGVELSNLKIII